MSYDPNWENSSNDDRVVAGKTLAKLSDAQEFAEPIDRRRLLMYLESCGYNWRAEANEPIYVDPLIGDTPGGDTGIRYQILELITSQSGMPGGSASGEWAYNWLWPVADADENKIVALDDSSTYVNIFNKLNAAGGWSSSSGGYIRAPHVNESRQMIEWLTRGRMFSKITMPVGIISMYPDEPWIGGLLAYNGEDELLTIGYAMLRSSGDPVKGMDNVQCRASSKITITAEYDCTVEAYHYTRNIDMSASHTWESLGGGLCDATLLGSVTLQAGVPGNVSGAAVAAAPSSIAAGNAPAYFLFRRSDESYETMYVWANVTADFDLNSPPN